MSFEAPEESLDDDDALDYDDELDGLSAGSPDRSSQTLVVFVTLTGAALLGLLLGPTLYRLAFGKTVGERCFTGGDCRSGTCLQPSVGSGLMDGIPMGGSGEGICTDDCHGDSDCPSELRCFGGNCAPKATAGLGESCMAPWDCRQGRCMFLRKNTPTFGGPPVPGVGTYEDTGTCRSQEQIEERRETIRKLRNAQEKMRRLQENLGQ